jgi:DNA-binding winged helix-turn-helix (wHTH) protein
MAGLMVDGFMGQLRFSSFVLDVKNCELRRNGIPVPLQKQPCKLLVWLALHANEVVSREQLRQQLWSTKTFVDFEAGLNFCVRQIRRALDEDARRPRLLETLHRRGYRFIGAVEPVNAGSATTPATREPRRITIAISPELEEGPVFTRLADGITSLLLSCLRVGDWTPVVSCNKVMGASEESMDTVLPLSSAVKMLSAGAELRINHGPLDSRCLALLRME